MEETVMPLGDRMRKYEDVFRHYLPPRLPVIIRLDGKAFHTVLRGREKPFDDEIINILNKTAIYTMDEIQGAELAYLQSDEINILVVYYKQLNSSAWFDNNIQKITSVTAAKASAVFNILMGLNNSGLEWGAKPALFDSRCFVLPESEVCNYFLHRQNDWTRNSIQMLARSLYSHKELDGKKCEELQEMCFAKGKNWNDLPTHLKRGRCVFKNGNVDNEIPIFSENREYIEKYLKIEEEKNASEKV